MAVTGYGRLFKSLNSRPSPPVVDDSGPASIPEPRSSSSTSKRQEEENSDESLLVKPEHYSQPLAFGFAPDITHLINPDADNMVRVETFLTVMIPFFL